MGDGGWGMGDGGWGMGRRRAVRKVPSGFPARDWRQRPAGRTFPGEPRTPNPEPRTPTPDPRPPTLYSRPTSARARSSHTLRMASRTMAPLILLSPSLRSVNTMGTSTSRKPRRHAR